MSNNGLAYALVAGVKTARIDSRLDISENWWGTIDHAKIKRQIFDFNDWNDHALAIFRPYLIEDDFDSSVSVSRSSQFGDFLFLLSIIKFACIFAYKLD